MKKVLATICIIAALIGLMPVRIAKADLDQVLLIYNDKVQMDVISSIITACGMVPVPVSSAQYTKGMAGKYEYVVLQDANPLIDILELDKKIICIGNSFRVIPGVEVQTVSHVMRANLEVYGNAQTVVLERGTPYISNCSGEMVGSITINGNVYPLGVIGEKIMYAPYLSAEDISVFAVAQMLNRYFGLQDGGKMYVMVDKVYPFSDIDMLMLTADRMYENGIPFIMSLMPVYSNTEYPSFARYANALRYIQSKSGSFIMHDPIITGNELVGDGLEERMERAFAIFEDNNVYVYDDSTFPYKISLDMLSGVQPQTQMFISVPINTVIVFDVFEDEEDLDAAISAVNQKWLQIGDYRRFFTDHNYAYREETVAEDFVYRETKESRYEFLVNAGNRVLLILVLVSAVIVIGLILLGYRLYRDKFFKKG